MPDAPGPGGGVAATPSDVDAHAVAEQRVDHVLERVANVAASSDFMILPAGSGHRRATARSEARRRAAGSGRSTLARRAREAVASILQTRYLQFHPRISYGWAAELTGAPDRVEISLALQDLALATAVEDLLPASTFEALARDGAVLLDEPGGEVQFAADGIEVGGPVDPDATPRAAIARVSLIVFAVAIAAGSLVVFSQLGLIPAALAVTLAALIVFTVMTAPSRRR